jgi:hypothetical protein
MLAPFMPNLELTIVKVTPPEEAEAGSTMGKEA